VSAKYTQIERDNAHFSTIITSIRNQIDRALNQQNEIIRNFNNTLENTKKIKDKMDQRLMEMTKHSATLELRQKHLKRNIDQLSKDQSKINIKFMQELSDVIKKLSHGVSSIYKFKQTYDAVSGELILFVYLYHIYCF